MMAYSAKLQAFVESLVARYRVSPYELHLRLQLTDAEQLVISQSADHRQIRLSRYVMMYQRPPVKDLEIVFYVDDQDHWIPYQYYRPPTDNQVCGVIDRKDTKLILDNLAYQRALANHCDLWATRLQSQGWLEQGMVFDAAAMGIEGEFLWPVPTVDEPDEDQLEAWLMDDVCEASDGCLVELDVAP